MAVASTAGFDPRAFMRCENDIELEILERVARRAIELNKQIRKELAILIISTLATSLNKGQSRQATSRNQSSTG